MLRPLVLAAATLATVLSTLTGPSADSAGAGPDIRPPLNDCWASRFAQRAAPQPGAETVSLSPGTVDVSQAPATIQVSVHADSPETGGTGGTAYVSTEVRGGIYDRNPIAVPLAPTTDDDHVLTGTFVVPRGASDYQLLNVVVTDGYGRGVTTSYAEADPGTRVAVTSAPDDTRPTVDSLLVSRTSLDTTRRTGTLRFTAHVGDDYSGVGTVTVLRGTTNPTGRFRTPLVPTDDPAVWTGSTRVPRHLGHRTWHYALQVTDQALNRQGATSDDPGAAATAVRIASGPVDQAPARIARPRVSPRPLDVRAHDGTLVVRVHVTDAGWGVSGVRASKRGLDRQGPTDLVLVSGTVRDGVWRGVLTISSCEGPAGRTRVVVEATDDSPLPEPTGPAAPSPSRCAPSTTRSPRCCPDLMTWARVTTWSSASASRSPMSPRRTSRSAPSRRRMVRAPTSTAPGAASPAPDGSTASRAPCVGPSSTPTTC